MLSSDVLSVLVRGFQARFPDWGATSEQEGEETAHGEGFGDLMAEAVVDAAVRPLPGGPELPVQRGQDAAPAPEPDHDHAAEGRDADRMVAAEDDPRLALPLVALPDAPPRPHVGAAPDQAAAPRSAAADGIPLPRGHATPSGATGPEPSAVPPTPSLPNVEPPTDAEATPPRTHDAGEPRADGRPTAPAAFGGAPPDVAVASQAPPPGATAGAEAGAAERSETGSSWRLVADAEAAGPASRAGQPATAPQVQPVAVAQQLAVALQSRDGDRVEIRLDPPELGRVQIELRTSEAGLHAVLLSERPETGELLRRHAALLQRELEAAGYGTVSLEFSGAGGGGGSGSGNDAEEAGGEAPAAPPTRPAAPAAALHGRLGDGRLDIRL